LRAAIAATNAFFVCCSASGDRPLEFGFVAVDASDEDVVLDMGSP
jgi:hypothetical protein